MLFFSFHDDMAYLPSHSLHTSLYYIFHGIIYLFYSHISSESPLKIIWPEGVFFSLTLRHRILYYSNY